MLKNRAHARSRRTATAATFLALLEDGPMRKTELQEALGCNAFDFGHAIATNRLHGFVELHGGLVQASKKGLDLLAANRRGLDADQATG